MWHYLYVFLASLAVDLLPFFGPPAWIVMVFFQMRFDLNIWFVLVAGVLGSTVGRYTLSCYIPYFSNRFIKPQTIADIEFIGSKLRGNGWKVWTFIILYTLMPLPSTPLFTASGIAKIRAIYILPGFLIGKFTSDLIMVLSGDYVAKNTLSITSGLFSWQSIAGSILGMVLLLLFLFIDWRTLLQQKKLKLNFSIWK